MEATNKT